jgi:hypothetical protein
LPPPAPGVYLNGPLQSCGIAVLISRDCVTPPKKATIGGIVCIGDEHYGLTTAHAFDEVEEAESISDGGFEFAFYGLGQSADSSDDEDDSMMTSRGEENSKSTRCHADQGKGVCRRVQAPARTRMTWMVLITILLSVQTQQLLGPILLPTKNKKLLDRISDLVPFLHHQRVKILLTGLL